MKKCLSKRVKETILLDIQHFIDRAYDDYEEFEVAKEIISKIPVCKK